MFINNSESLPNQKRRAPPRGFEKWSNDLPISEFGPRHEKKDVYYVYYWARHGSGDLASSEVRSLSTTYAFLEHATGTGGTTGTTRTGELVSRTASRTPLPHAPGARITVVTLTPSNKKL